MNFIQIECFINVIKLKSFSKAGDMIYLTQPTISSHINTLEKELNIILIDRSSKDIIPTDAGKIFYEHCLSIINARDHALLEMDKFNHSHDGKINISASTIPSQFLLPIYIKNFNITYPNITFNINQTDSKSVIESILNQTDEIGFVGTVIPNNKLEYIKIADDDLVIAAPVNDKYADNNLSLKKLLEKPFLLREVGSGTRLEFENILKKYGHKLSDLNIIAQMTSGEAIKESIKLGLGISVVSAVSITDYVNFNMIKVLNIPELDMKRCFYIVKHKKRPLSTMASLFIDFVCDI